VKPLLTELAKPSYIVELASPEECAMIDEGMAEYYSDPASFIPLADVK
jgi:hypothetical protein